MDIQSYIVIGSVISGALAHLYVAGKDKGKQEYRCNAHGKRIGHLEEVVDAHTTTLAGISAVLKTNEIIK